MKNIDNLTIETESLLLVPLAEKYIQELFQEFNEEVTRDMRYAPSKNIEETKDNVQEALQKVRDGVNIDFIALEKDTQAFAGRIILSNIDTPTPVIGFRIKESAQGKGYGKEMVKSVIDWAQENIYFTCILYKVNKENFRSLKLVEYIGGVPVLDESGNPLLKKRKSIGGKKEQYGYEYKIYKHLSLPTELKMTNEISDTEYANMIYTMKQNDLSRYNIGKDDFIAIKDAEEEIVAFGRAFEIGEKQWELGSLWVDPGQRGKKLGLVIFEELIKKKRGDNEIYLATKRELGGYYEPLGFQITTQDIPEKLFHTQKRAEGEGIDFIVMKLA